MNRKLWLLVLSVTFILIVIPEALCRNLSNLTQIVISHAGREQCGLYVTPVRPCETHRALVGSTSRMVTFNRVDTQISFLLILRENTKIW